MPPRLPAATWLRVSLALLALSLAAPAFAATTPPGVNLRWDACYDDGGAANKLFACDTNAGTDKLVLSFVLDTPMSGVSGMEIQIEFWSAGASMPAWWQVFNAGTCRQAGLTMNTALDPLATNCVDWSNTLSVGGIGAYTIGSPGPLGSLGPNTALLGIATGVPVAGLAALDPGQEYFIANLNVRHIKTVGTGACAGCDIPACIVFSKLKVTTQLPANDRVFILGANNIASQFATWQSGLVVNPTVLQHLLTGPRMSMENCVAAATGTRRPTWGAVKSLYR